MSAPVAVRVDDRAAAALGPSMAATLASLPLSFAAATELAELVVVDGGEGWSERIAAAGPVRAAIVVEPRATGDPGGVPIVIDRSLAGNPVMPAIAARLADIDTAALLEVRISAGVDAELRDILTEAIALSRAVTGSALAELRSLDRGHRGATLRGRDASGRPVLLSVTLSDSVVPSARVRAIAQERSLDAHLPARGAARPARLTVSGPEGAMLLPTLYETAHRAAWRRTLRVLRGEEPGDQADDIRADLELVDSLELGAGWPS